MSLPPLITRDKDVLGGVPVFYGSRVPVQTLIDYLATGGTIDAFLDDFPSVTKEQAVRFLETIGAFVASQDDANPS